MPQVWHYVWRDQEAHPRMTRGGAGLGCFIKGLLAISCVDMIIMFSLLSSFGVALGLPLGCGFGFVKEYKKYSNPLPSPPRASSSSRVLYHEPALYARGSRRLAIQIARDSKLRAEAKSELVHDAYASTSVSPFESRKATWDEIAQAAGFAEPFNLTGFFSMN